MTPPHHADAEQAVLGGVIIQPDLFHSVADILAPQDFYAPKHQRIFSIMLELDNSGEPIDLVTLTSRLKDQNLLEESGGAAYITSLLDRVPTTAHIEHHARIVHEASMRRKVIYAAQDIVKEGIEGSHPVDQFIDYSESRIFEVTHERQKKDFADIRTILKNNMSSIDSLYNKKDAITGVSTGFIELDSMTSGLQPSDLIIIAARPSMGKTAFALNIATSIGLQKKGSVAVFSLEMSKESLGIRMLSAQSKVDSKRLRNGQLYESDWPKLIRSAGVLSEAPIFVDDTPAISVMEMRSSCRRMATRGKLALVLVDYLQLMRGSSARSESREKEISEISRGLKSLAKELQVPVMALSQLNRSVDSRPDKRPMMSDLRESGAIEQDADVIAFIYRDEVYNKDTESKGIAEILIAKQRNGPTGTVYLTWLDKYTAFENLASSGSAPQTILRASDVLNRPPPTGPQGQQSGGVRLPPPPHLDPSDF